MKGQEGEAGRQGFPDGLPGERGEAGLPGDKGMPGIGFNITGPPGYERIKMRHNVKRSMTFGKFQT